MRKRRNRRRTLGETVRRAFVEFLTLPSLIIAGFLLLAAGTYALDRASVESIESMRALLRERVFRDTKATSDLLGVIATSLITVTSITFSLLLLAVQQSAAALTSQVYDQFLRRRINQTYFGFFVGLALYSLVILATVDPPHNPIFGAALAFLLTIVALYFVILLLYTTIDQMRPPVVIEAIHDHTLVAWERHRTLLRQTRRFAQSSGPGGAVPLRIPAEKHGFVVCVDVENLHAAAKKAKDEVEIVLLVCVGSFVAFQDTLAEIRGCSQAESEILADAVRSGIHLEEQRDLDTDPAYGIEQMGIIAWTTISTAKSDPYPGTLVIHNLRDLLARWSIEQNADDAPKELLVVYADDVFAHLLDAFENLAVVASESMQAQTMAEIVRTFALMFERLPVNHQPRAEDVIRRSLSSLGEHVLTAGLNDALSDLVRALNGAGRSKTAAQAQAAREALAASVGKLGSRATRVKEGG